MHDGVELMLIEPVHTPASQRIGNLPRAPFERRPGGVRRRNRGQRILFYNVAVSQSVELAKCD